jgi:hypothetical protein
MEGLSRWTVTARVGLRSYEGSGYSPKYNLSSARILGSMIFVAFDDFSLHEDNLTLGVL